MDEKGICIINPDVPIDNCLKYETVTTCVECTDGSYLENYKKCTIIETDELIENCATHDPTENSIKCMACNAGYYLSGSCKERDNKVIDNCNALDPGADKCLTCNDGYFLSSTRTACVSGLANCAVHQSFNDDVLEEDLVCTRCDDQYFVNSGACQEGDDD